MKLGGKLYGLVKPTPRRFWPVAEHFHASAGRADPGQVLIVN